MLSTGPLPSPKNETSPAWARTVTRHSPSGITATKAITIKIVDDDDDDDNDEDQNEDSLGPTTLQLKRTPTGIISNRRPLSGTPASGISTPDTDTYPRTSVMTIAKREAARKGLYSRFFRGPTLAPDDPSNLPSSPAPSPLHSADPTPERETAPQTDVPNCTKRKSSELLESREQRRERKRLKREMKEKKSAKRAAKARKEKPVLHDFETKHERRARKEAKRAMKTFEAISSDIAERRQLPGVVAIMSLHQPRSQGQCERSVDASPQVDDPAAEDSIDTKKTKKKREKKGLI